MSYDYLKLSETTSSFEVVKKWLVAFLAIIVVATAQYCCGIVCHATEFPYIWPRIAA